MNSESHDSGDAHWGAAIRAGGAYVLCVFVIAFAVGAIRVTLVEPRVGALIAVALEAPLVLFASWTVSRWAVRRFNVGPDSRARMLMGIVAFSALMVLELVVAVLAFGEPLEHYFDRFATAPGMLGLVFQLGFAVIPWVQGAMGRAAPQR